MFEIAALLSALVEHWADNAIQLLKQKLALMARVRRDGQWLTMRAEQLVPGDPTRIRLGDIIPADLRLLHGDYLEVDQSALTGESLPVERHVGDLVYSGSVASKVEMNGVVIATGMQTYFGWTARLVQETTVHSHYQEAVLKIGHFLIVSTFVLVGLIILAAMFRKDPMLETVQFSLILTVAVIPVALPAVLSVTMAVGAARLARHKAIVSRLVSIEEMAGMDVLCSDKTGTLTQNRLRLGDPVLVDAPSGTSLIHDAALASRAENHDPIEQAIFERVESGSLDGYSVDRFLPFDPIIIRTEATGICGEKRFTVTKGGLRSSWVSVPIARNWRLRLIRQSMTWRLVATEPWLLRRLMKQATGDFLACYHFWRKPYPSGALFWTCELTQVVATLIAVYGVLRTPIGWQLASLVWAYSLGWFVLNDFIKVKVYHLITHRALRERQHLERIEAPLHP